MTPSNKNVLRTSVSSGPHNQRTNRTFPKIEYVFRPVEDEIEAVPHLQEGDIAADPTAHPKQQLHSQSPDIQPQSRRSISPQPRKRKRTPSPETQPTTSIHPQSIATLQRGNSDPFKAAEITISPQINQILVFARDICLPAFYFVDSLRDTSDLSQPNRDVTNSSGWISSPAARLGWQQVIDSLEDKCTALACLSTYLALMAACNIHPTSTTTASLKMRAASSALLRQALARPRDKDVKKQRELLWQVFWHFYAEFFAGNMVAAQIHGNMIRQFCETAEPEVITPHFLDSVVFIDTQLSAKYMIRTILDVDKWVPKMFAHNWDVIDPHVADMTQENGDDLDESVLDEPLKSIFVRTRQSAILLNSPVESHAVDLDFNTLYYWLNSHAYVDSGRLIDHYLNLTEQHLQRQDSTPAYLYTQAALSAALLYVIRDIGHEIKINNIDLVDASSTIVRHLRVSLEQAYLSSNKAEKEKYRTAHLWCAAIGALDEQRAFEAAPSTAATSYPWFCFLLAEIAHGMEMLTWVQISEKVFKHFVYSDAVEPHGSRWFWKVMGTYLDRMDRPASPAAARMISINRRSTGLIEGQKDVKDKTKPNQHIDPTEETKYRLPEKRTQEQIRQQRILTFSATTSSGSVNAADNRLSSPPMSAGGGSAKDLSKTQVARNPPRP